MSSILKKAFTLIELLVVIAIIGILSGLIIVGMNGMTRQASIAKSQIFNNSLRNSLMGNVSLDMPLDGSGEDVWNHNATTTTVGTPTAQTINNCVQNTCYNFGGAAAFLIADDNSATKAIYKVTNNMTAMIWVKGVAQASKGVFAHWGAAGQREWEIMSGATNGYLEVKMSADGTAITKDLTTTSAAPFDGNWHLVGFTMNSGAAGGVVLYVDGVVASAGSTDGVIASLVDTGTSAIGVGCEPATPTTCANYFTGLLDSARFYYAAIPISQIKELYFAGLNNLFAKGQITAQEYTERINAVGINN